ncbi:MAG: asparagine synthase (glutamine-hydrolyzing) [Bacteroidetes bacterium]|nr:asparagine synthase (glutamine-hydrolyzing) [Bacteroidota bacterium]
MCGIAGFIDNTRSFSEDQLNNMTGTLAHRGPDGTGGEIFKTDTCNLGLGHKRLSIIDLHSNASQPMFYGDWCIVFNGEIYNFQEIKDELINKGRSFNTQSDTEVILQAIDEWGHAAVNFFIGMFAFALYHKVLNRVFFYRDRAGVKPLYYYTENGQFLFSSELKAFHKYPAFKKELNRDAAAQFLQYGYILAPNTIFRNTFKVKPGHYIDFDLTSSTFTEHKYWDVTDFYNKPKLDISENEAKQKTEELLTSSCIYRMVSDVPVGVFLSGGYDSSTVAAILQRDSSTKIKTFTIGFEEKKYDEASYAKKVADHLGTDHTTQYCTIKDASSLIPLIPEYWDEPFADASAIPTMLVSKLARQSVTVALSADAGDELFAGYTKYSYILNTSNKIKGIPSSIRSSMAGLLQKIDPDSIPYFNSTYNFKTRYYKGISLLKANTVQDGLKGLAKFFTDHEIDQLFHGSATSDGSSYLFSGISEEFADDLSKLLCTDYKTYMVDDILTKVDRASMSVSLEGREPLLDHRLVEFVAQLPNHFKIKNGNKKYLLKEICHQYLPKDLMDRKKMGFGIPLVEWFEAEIKEYINLYLNSTYISAQGLFRLEAIDKLLKGYDKNKSENVFKLWNLIMFQLWYERWMK